MVRSTIGLMVENADEADRLTGQMRAAGARAPKEPVDADFFSGRSATSATLRATTSTSPGRMRADNLILMVARRAA